MNKFGMKQLGYGLGLRSEHYDHVLENSPKVDWFEVISENYMNTLGRPRQVLERVRADYPIVMHGVSMSIGSSDELNMEYLQCLKDLADEIEPEWISDHLCWTGIAGKNTHDLLPVPLTEETLQHVVERIKRVQDFLERRILLENPSSYLTYRADEIPEYEFMARMAKEADCGLLLDANNVYVASFNQRLNPFEYIDAIPMDHVVQLHLAGHQNKGTHIVDTHDSPVIDDVWELYKYITLCEGFGASTMVEWDDKIPEFAVLEAELEKARKFAGQVPNLREYSNDNSERMASNESLLTLQKTMQNAIMDGDVSDANTWIMAKKDFAPEEQLAVYTIGYRLRLSQIISADYVATMKCLGAEKTQEILREYIETVPSEFYDVAKFSAQFAGWLQGQNVSEFAKELVRLEALVSECYNLRERPSLEYEDLAGVAAEEFVSLQIKPSDSVLLVHFEHDVNAYMNAFYEQGELVEIAQESFVAVYLKSGKVFRMGLEKDEFDLLEILKTGKIFAAAMEELVVGSQMEEVELGEKIEKWFARWMREGLLLKLI